MEEIMTQTVLVRLMIHDAANRVYANKVLSQELI